MSDIIKGLIREYKTKLLLTDRKLLKIKKSDNISEICNVINPIILLMNKSEKDVISLYSDEIRELKLYDVDTEPILPGVSRGEVLNVRIQHDLIIIRCVSHYCGGKSYSIKKIPLRYLDMTDSDIVHHHWNWCNTDITSCIKKSKEVRIEKNKKEIIRLMEENKILNI